MKGLRFKHHNLWYVHICNCINMMYIMQYCEWYIYDVWYNKDKTKKERWLTIREVPGSNPIGDIAFFSVKTCSTVTHDYTTTYQISLIYLKGQNIDVQTQTTLNNYQLFELEFKGQGQTAVMMICETHTKYD